MRQSPKALSFVFVVALAAFGAVAAWKGLGPFRADPVEQQLAGAASPPAVTATAEAVASAPGDVKAVQGGGGAAPAVAEAGPAGAQADIAAARPVVGPVLAEVASSVRRAKVADGTRKTLAPAAQRLAVAAKPKPPAARAMAPRAPQPRALAYAGGVRTPVVVAEPRREPVPVAAVPAASLPPAAQAVNPYLPSVAAVAALPAPVRPQPAAAPAAAPQVVAPVPAAPAAPAARTTNSPYLASNPYLAAQTAAPTLDPMRTLDGVLENVQRMLPSLPPEGQAILPVVKTVYPTGDKPLKVLTFKCPTELVGISPPSVTLLHQAVNVGMSVVNSTNLLPFNMQQVCQ